MFLLDRKPRSSGMHQVHILLFRTTSAELVEHRRGVELSLPACPEVASTLKRLIGSMGLYKFVDSCNYPN